MRFRILPALVLSGIVVFAVQSSPVLAADGDLDPIFNSTGKYVGTASGQLGYAVAVQTNQKIVVATQLAGQMSVQRHNVDGTLDTDFGASSSGKTTSVGGFPRALALDPDGNIFVAGYCNIPSGEAFCLWKFDSNGSPVAAFGTAGRADVDMGTNQDRAFGLAVQPDGKLIVVGHSINSGSLSRLAVVRFTTDGQLDTTFNASNPTFGVPGTFVVEGQNAIAGRDVHVLPGGDIVVAVSGNYSGQPSRDDFLLTRLNSDGTVDTDFGNSGWSQFDFGGAEVATDMFVTAAGMIHLAGYTDAPASLDAAVIRVNLNGGLDNTFGSSGWSIVPFSGDSDFTSGVEVQTDGKVLLGGYTVPSSGRVARIARLTDAGNLDPSFGSAGQVTVNSGEWTSVEEMSLQADGKLVTVGNHMLADNSGATVGILRIKATSTNAGLSALTTTAGSLTPSFATATTSYSAAVSGNVTSITVSPTASDRNASVTVNGQTVTAGSQSNALAMQEGANTVTIVVTAQDGVTTKTYTLTVTRATASTTPSTSPPTTSAPSTTIAPSTTVPLDAAAPTPAPNPVPPTGSAAPTNAQPADPLLQAIQVAGASITPNFSAATMSYRATVPNQITSVAVTGTALDGSHRVSVNDGTSTFASVTVTVRLVPGANPVSVRVDSPQSGASNTYRVIVDRQNGTITRGRSLSVSSVLRTADVTLLRGARTRVSVAGASRKVCRATASRVTALAKGTCRVTVTVTKGSSTKRYSVTLTVL